MKYVLSFSLLFLLFSFRLTDGIYDITIKTIDGNSIRLSQYKGKKLLFILLPVSTQDTRVSIQDITGLQTKYQSSLVIIGIFSEEAGYKKEDAAQLKNRYRQSGAGIVIAEGMKVKRGEGQSPLLQWLTNKDLNHHFDQDVEEVGSKFFVSEDGELYAVMGSRTALTSPLMDRIVTRSPAKNNQEKKN